MAAGADGVEVSAPPYSKPFPDEIVQYYRDISSRRRRAAAGLQLATRHQRRDPPDLFEQLVDITTVVAVKDSTPNADQFFETTGASSAGPGCSGHS